MQPSPTDRTPDNLSTAPQPAAFGQSLPWLLLIGGIIGTVAAAVLIIEKMRLLTNPDYVPSCSLNPVLSCGSIMLTPQAEAFGFPNPLIGVAGFAAVATIGAVLMTGAQLPRWFWLALLAGTAFGVTFVTWLMIQSLYVIGALCPYCMIVWAVMIPIFVYVTMHTIDQRHIRLPAALQPAGHALVRYHTVVVTSWFLAIMSLIAIRFWYYWSTVL